MCTCVCARVCACLSVACCGQSALQVRGISIVFITHKKLGNVLTTLLYTVFHSDSSLPYPLMSTLHLLFWVVPKSMIFKVQPLVRGKQHIKRVEIFSQTLPLHPDPSVMPRALLLTVCFMRPHGAVIQDAQTDGSFKKRQLKTNVPQTQKVEVKSSNMTHAAAFSLWHVAVTPQRPDSPDTWLGNNVCDILNAGQCVRDNV